MGLYGNTLDPSQTRGFGFGGAPTGPVTGGRSVPLADRTLQLPLAEIGDETFRNINVLRGILRGDLVAQPALDISAASFTAFMRAAEAIGANETFDPYETADNFLLGAFLICDTMVTAYLGLLPAVDDPIVLTTMSGLLTTRAAHAAIIRQLLYRRSTAVPGLLTLTQKISNYRDRLSGAGGRDQGIAPSTVSGLAVSNLTMADRSGEAFGRTGPQVLNILYGSASAVTRGGFFPQGAGGSITTSAAN